MNYAAYASLADLRTQMGYTASDTTDDTRLLACLEAVSEWIEDSYLFRHFSVRNETRTFTAESPDSLLLDDDLLSITTLKTDDDDDWDYDNSWATTDYHLWPFNKFPKTEILVKSGGNYEFTSQEEGVQIAGLFGHGTGETATPYEDAGTNTAEVLDASETGVDVGSGAAFSAGQTILVESEQMYISSISSNTLTVVRAVNGTTAATHATDKDIYIYRYPKRVKEATAILAERLFRSKDAPFGMVGSSETSLIRIGRFMDAYTQNLLESFRRIPVA